MKPSRGRREEWLTWLLVAIVVGWALWAVLEALDREWVDAALRAAAAMGLSVLVWSRLRERARRSSWSG